MPAFGDYDLDGDGTVVEKEFHEARAKRISERVRQGYQMKNIGKAPAFADLDSDGDGELSREEFAAHQAQRRQPKPATSPR
jgi:Ca2+-binding EF-hand superfamily protein